MVHEAYALSLCCAVATAAPMVASLPPPPIPRQHSQRNSKYSESTEVCMRREYGKARLWHGFCTRIEAWRWASTHNNCRGIYRIPVAVTPPHLAHPVAAVVAAAALPTIPVQVSAQVLACLQAQQLYLIHLLQQNGFG